MKKLYYLIILALILGLVLTGCTLLSNISQVPATEQSGNTYLTKETPGEHDVFTLYAGQTIPVGTVTVSNDGDDLTVIYNTTDGWVMTETHLAVVTEYGDFPMTKKGNPKVGHFPYGGEDIFTETWKKTIELEDFNAWQELYIAAHVATEKVTCFDGTSGLTIDDTEDLNIDGSITVEALVKVEVSAKDKFYTVVGKWNEGGNARAWLLGIFNLRPCFYISTNGTSFARAIVDLGEELNIGQWYHLKGTFDSVTGEIKIYIDGILEKTNNTTYNNINLDTVPVFIGEDLGGGNKKRAFFNGCIHEVKVWDDGIEEGEPPVLEIEWPEIVTEETAWAVNGSGDEYIGKMPFHGKNWATYFKWPHSTYAFQYEVPDDIVAGVECVVPVIFEATEVNELGYPGVRFKFSATGPGDVDFTATDTQNNVITQTNNGFWGPDSGFDLPANYWATTDWTLTFSQPGGYTITFSLIEAPNGPVVDAITGSQVVEVVEL